MTPLLVGDLGAAALLLPGHDVLGPNPGIALLHLDQQETIAPALLNGLQHAVRGAFSGLLVGRGYFGGDFQRLAGLKEIPLRSA